MILKMKKVNFLASVILNLILMSVFVSCENEKNNDKDLDNDNDISINTISAKWEMSDSNSPYASFEFNEDGYYIVVENSEAANLKANSSPRLKEKLLKRNNKVSLESNLSPIHFGTYIIDGNNIILSGFGLIEVVSISNEEFTFSFILESNGEKNSFVAGKSEEPISPSNRTDMLCRTWEVDEVTIDINYLSDDVRERYKEKYGEDWINVLKKDRTAGSEGLILLFSKAGTYLVLYSGEERDAGLSEWKWVDKEETSIYYSWENWTDNWDNNIVAITELNTTNLSFREDIAIWHLLPKK